MLFRWPEPDESWQREGVGAKLLGDELGNGLSLLASHLVAWNWKEQMPRDGRELWEVVGGEDMIFLVGSFIGMLRQIQDGEVVR